MKKLGIILFSLLLVMGVILLVACANNTTTSADKVETTEVTTVVTEKETTEVTTILDTTMVPIETTTEEEITEATTEEETTEATTEEETTEAVPEIEVAVYDIDFSSDGKVSDKNGLMTFELKGQAKVANTSVTHNGVTYTVPALNIKTSNSGCVCTYDDLKTESAVQNFYNSDFSAEVFYVNRIKSTGVQAALCQTESAGWGIAELSQANGKAPYFIIHVGGAYKQVNAKTGRTSDKELTHVLAVYNKSAGEIAIYINGEFAGSTNVSGSFKAISSQYTQSYRSIVLGADYSKEGLLSEFNMTDFTCVDAKIYDYALTDEEAKLAYQIAVAGLSE